MEPKFDYLSFFGKKVQVIDIDNKEWIGIVNSIDDLSNDDHWGVSLTVLNDHRFDGFNLNLRDSEIKDIKALD